MINVKIDAISDSMTMSSSEIIILVNDKEICHLSAKQSNFNAIVSSEKKIDLKIKRLYLKNDQPKENILEKILNSVGLLIEKAGTFARPLKPVYECEEIITIEAFNENPEIRITCGKNTEAGWSVFNVQTLYCKVIDSTKIIKVSKEELAYIIQQRKSEIRQCLMLPTIIFTVILMLSIISWNKLAIALSMLILIIAWVGMLLNYIILKKNMKK